MGELTINNAKKFLKTYKEVKTHREPEYWRGKAEESRVIGENIANNKEVQTVLLDLADQYEELADRIDRDRQCDKRLKR